VAGHCSRTFDPVKYETFQSVELGRIRIGQAGVGSVVVRPDKASWSPVNLRTVTLKPAK